MALQDAFTDIEGAADLLVQAESESTARSLARTPKGHPVSQRVTRQSNPGRAPKTLQCAMPNGPGKPPPHSTALAIRGRPANGTQTQASSVGNPPPLSTTLAMRSGPTYAYRVVLDDSWTEYLESGGLRPAVPSTKIGHNGFFRMYVQNHISWKSGMESPFISLFTNKAHAEAWAERVADKRYVPGYELLTINLELVPRKMYSLGYLVEQLGIKTSLHPSQYRSEILVHGVIPGCAVVDRESYLYEPFPCEYSSGRDKYNELC